MSRLRLLLALAPLAGACHLIYPFGTASPDADAGPADAEAGAVDASPDLHAGDLRDGPPEEQASLCDVLWAKTVPGYILCEETATSCRFYFKAPDAGGTLSCKDLCSPGACLKMEDNIKEDDCTLEVPNRCGSSPCSCTTQMFDSLCTCAK